MFSRARARGVKNPKRIDSRFVKEVCHAIGADKYAERWIWIRREALRWLGIPHIQQLLRDAELTQICRDFQLASTAFDECLYRGGHKRTARDLLWQSDHPLSRHNFPNYNYVWHCLFMRRGKNVRRQVDAHFYFPLLKTEKVLNSIHSMWQVICAHLGWECPKLSHILDRRYRHG